MESPTGENNHGELHPLCVARTPDAKLGSEANSGTSIQGESFFRSAEWTADGTTIITSSSDNDVRTFVVPPDLLEQREEPHNLIPYSISSSKEPVSALTTYPLFDLQDPSTTLVLSSTRDHPIRLNSALAPVLVASYPLINPKTEAFITPRSLLFRRDGSRFIAGSDNLISIFDVSRSGNGPVLSLATAPKSNRSLTNPGAKMRGLISALAVEEYSGLLAAGTFTRNIGLYDSGGTGECVGVFTVEGTEADKRIGGRGVIQVAWSPDGRYLYIAERKSNGIMIYDIRHTGQLVAWLEGRRAMTNQRLCFSSNEAAESHEVWAGGTDGVVRLWKNTDQQQGGTSAFFEFAAHTGQCSYSYDSKLH